MRITDFVKRQQLTQSPVMLAIDQFEDLYRGPPDRSRYRDLLIEDLAEALERYKELRVLIVIRDDALAEFEASGNLIPDARFSVAGIRRDAAIQAATEPLRGTGRILEEDAAGVLADELLAVRRSSDNLVEEISHEISVPPTYLQLACICLWHSIPLSLAVITPDHVRKYLDIDLCFSGFVRQVLIGILQRYDLPSEQLSNWLTQSFIASEGLSVSLTSAESRSILLPLLRSLEDCHILVSEHRSGNHYFKIASSRLMKPLKMAIDSIRHLPRSISESVQVVDYLADAARGYDEGELEVAERQAIAALQDESPNRLAARARAETLLANIAFERGETAQSRHFYERAAALFEVVGDSAAVGNLLAAVGRLQMISSDNTAAVATLQSAVNRLPADSTVKIELARAFANSGEPNAAAAILESAITISADIGVGDAHILRDEILSDFEDAASL
jgi:tetratricopeptide (TPR) repeat protein